MAPKYTVYMLILLGTYSQFLISQGPLDGFLKGQGNMVTALSYSDESYEHYYIGNQKTSNANLGTIRTKSANVFVTGGLTDYLDLILTLPYISTTASEGFWSDQHDIQDFGCYLKGRFYSSDLGHQGQLQLLGAVGATTPLSDYVADAPVSIGSQSTQLESRLIGHLKYNNGIFITSQFGYIKRNNIGLDRGFEISVPDAWDYVLRVGGSFKKFYADTWVQHQNSRTGTNIGPGIPFPSNEVDFTKIGFTLFHPLPVLNHFGISLGTAFTLNGKNIGQSNRISAALVYDFTIKESTEPNSMLP
jgi:hypothetical protein